MSKKPKYTINEKPAGWIQTTNLDALVRRSGKPLKDGDQVYWTWSGRLKRANS